MASGRTDGSRSYQGGSGNVSSSADRRRNGPGTASLRAREPQKEVGNSADNPPEAKSESGAGTRSRWDKKREVAETNTSANDDLPLEEIGPVKQLPGTPLALALGRAFHAKLFPDIIIVSEKGVEMPAHKAILASQSPVFLNHFSQLRAEPSGKPSLYVVKGVSTGALRSFLYLLYSASCGRKAVESYCVELLLLASKYEVEWLNEFLEAEVPFFVNERNAVALLQQAHQSGTAAAIAATGDSGKKRDGFERLKERCMEIVVACYPSLVTRPDFGSLTAFPDLMLEIMRRVAAPSASKPGLPQPGASAAAPAGTGMSSAAGAAASAPVPSDAAGSAPPFPLAIVQSAGQGGAEGGVPTAQPVGPPGFSAEAPPATRVVLVGDANGPAGGSGQGNFGLTGLRIQSTASGDTYTSLTHPPPGNETMARQLVVMRGPDNPFSVAPSPAQEGIPVAYPPPEGGVGDGILPPPTQYVSLGTLSGPQGPPGSGGYVLHSPLGLPSGQQPAEPWSVAGPQRGSELEPALMHGAPHRDVVFLYDTTPHDRQFVPSPPRVARELSFTTGTASAPPPIVSWSEIPAAPAQLLPVHGGRLYEEARGGRERSRSPPKGVVANTASDPRGGPRNVYSYTTYALAASRQAERPRGPENDWREGGGERRGSYQSSTTSPRRSRMR